MAAKLYKINKKNELIERVQAELHRKDSTEVLLGEFVESLHQADHIEDSPRHNAPVDLLSIDETMNDSYSRK